MHRMNVRQTNRFFKGCSIAGNGHRISLICITMTNISVLKAIGGEILEKHIRLVTR